jgi:DNA-binding response OmpR family regulator
MKELGFSPQSLPSSGNRTRISSIATMANSNSQLGPKLLSISSVRRDHSALRQILSQTGWQLAAARTCRGARELLHRRSVSAIFCESDLPDGTWRDILSLSTNTSQPPPVIVTSRLPDDRLWAEVLNLGGYDVLAKPFHEQEVRHVLTSAGTQFERRYHASAGGPGSSAP